MPKRDRTTNDGAVPETGAGTVTIEADSVEEAMNRLASEVGDSAEIVDARKVQRGGIGGFFAKERVQLIARAATAPRDEPAEPEGLAGVLDRMTRDAEAKETQFATMLRRELGSDKRDLGLDTFLEAVGWDDRTSADEAARAHTAVGEITAAMTAATELRNEVDAVDAPVSTDDAAPAATPAPDLPAQETELIAAPAVEVTPTPAELPMPLPVVVQRTGTPASLPGPSLIGPGAVPPPQPTAAAPADSLPDWRITTGGAEPSGMGPVAWRTMDLVRQGIPTEIVGAVADIDPNDDIAWITGLASAVAPYCGESEPSDTVLLGTNAYQLAEALGIEWVEPGQTAPYEGSFASYVSPSAEDREWLEFVRGTRALHMVIGGDQAWRHAMAEAPNVVSWFDESALIDALYLAVACDARLGYGVLPGRNGALTRIYPVDVALAIRTMMERS